MLLLIHFQTERWVKQTHPFTPSFVFMYWSITRGRQQLVWEGILNIKTVLAKLLGNNYRKDINYVLYVRPRSYDGLCTK